MFNLQKWASNNEELMDLIRKEREQRALQAEPAVIDKPDSVSDNMINDPENCKTVTQDSVTVAKVSVSPDLQEINSLNQVKILRNRWDFREDLLTFDFQSLVEFAREYRLQRGTLFVFTAKFLTLLESYRQYLLF